ncbi:serine/threonine-protein kinase [Acidobacteria bacterium AH-259-L09]|nr:serine/threonine-protein kinase [Acidobacteria bacterium AH-259-L09]
MELGTHRTTERVRVGNSPPTVARAVFLSQQVYLAQDTSLDRKVALKFLSDFMQEDPTARKRFLREAKSAAALDHPYICHIHEVGEVEGKSFIAMEYVQGTTLQDRLGGDPLSVKEALQTAAEVAEALEEAHKRGIVHRDVKPSNIMLTQQGHVKVMDFGLAKRLVAIEGVDSQQQTLTASLTKTGMMLGTLAYMSPEQLRGEEVDTRSDIFSFGVVLYEMLTGVHAFKKSQPMETGNAILNEAPAPLSRHMNEVPPVLQHIVRKMLAKEPDGRYQLIHDVRTDLGELLEDMARIAPAGLTWIDARLVHFLKWLKSSHLIWPAVLLTLVVGAVSWLYFGSPSSETSLPPMKIVPLTSYQGIEQHPSFSPDGSQVVFSWNGENQDNYDIYVKLIGSGTPLRLTADPSADSSPGWSPDGRQIAFLRARAQGVSEVLLVPPLGGPERKLGEILYPPGQFGTGLSWSPDGKFLVVPDRSAPEEPTAIFLLAVDNGEKKRLTLPPEESVYGDIMPHFSPDGRTVAFERHPAWAMSDIYALPVTGGEPTRLTFTPGTPDGLAWASDGREIVFLRGGELWKISRNGGTPQRLPGVGENPIHLAVSSEKRRLAYTRREYHVDIWRVDTQASGIKRPSKVIASTRHDANPQFSPEGKRIVFASNREGTYEIWICDNDGSNSFQVTSVGGAGTPRWSPDGQRVAFDSRAGGNPDIYVVSASGGSARRITSGSFADTRPSWSRDGHWIYFTSNRSGEEQIWKVPVEGEVSEESVAVQVTKNGGNTPFESADGRYVYYAKRAEGRASAVVWKVPVEEGEETPVTEPFAGGVFKWALAEKGIYFVDQRDTSSSDASWVVKFFSFDQQGVTEIAELTHPPHGRGPGLTVSPDGRWILGSQVEISSDLILVEDFR